MDTNLVIVETPMITDISQLCDESVPMEQDDCSDKDKFGGGGGGGRRNSSGKRGRKPAKVDVKAKLERSRQSARECRARKKLRYQYLEELVACRERAIHALREELDIMKQVCGEVDQGQVSPQTLQYVEQEKARMAHRQRMLVLNQGRQRASSSQCSLSEQE